MYFFLLEYLNRSRHPLLKTAVFFFFSFFFLSLFRFIYFIFSLRHSPHFYISTSTRASSGVGSQIEFWTFIEIQWTYRNKSEYQRTSLSISKYFFHSLQFLWSFPSPQTGPLAPFFYYSIFIFIYIIHSTRQSWREDIPCERERDPHSIQKCKNLRLILPQKLATFSLITFFFFFFFRGGGGIFLLLLTNSRAAASGARPTPFKDFYTFFFDDAIAEVKKEDEVRVVPRWRK